MIILSFISAFLLSACLTWIIIKISAIIPLKQFVRKEGPNFHLQTKTNIPAFGGLAIIAAVLFASFIFIDVDIHTHLISLPFLLVGYTAIGLLDDGIKIFRKDNLGLSASQKFILQILVSVIFSFIIIMNSVDLGVQGFLKAAGFGFWPLYLFLSVFITAGLSNAANLTDGLDGLLSGCASIAFLSFAFIALKLHNSPIAIFCFIFAGALLGFLVFNFNPAKIFMGDVGSLPIGAALAAVALFLHQELNFIIICGVLVVETLSVMLQVAWYKKFKTRIFKMSPLHHHFELSGFKEKQIVFAAYSISIICGIIGYVLA